MHILDVQREHGEAEPRIKLFKLHAVNNAGSKCKLWLQLLTQIKTARRDNGLGWLAMAQPRERKQKQINQL